MVGYLLAGVAALLSAIIHKLANLFILYGTDLLTIYSNLFEFLKKQFGLENATAQGLITGIISVYVFLGLAAATAGYFLGRKAARLQDGKEPDSPDIDPFQSAWKRTDPDRPFRIILLILHVGMIPLMLLLINRFGLSFQSLAPAVIYTGFLLLYYKRIKYRLMKPFFWSQLLIMTLVAGFFWHPPDADSFRITSGFLVGIEMSLRAIIIVSAFSAISVEIRNPLITDKLLKMGMGNGYAAISLAFNSLPAMLDRSGSLKSFITNPVRSFSKMVYEAEAWLQCFQTHLKK